MVLPGEGHLEGHAPLAWLGEGEGGIINASAFWYGLDMRDGRGRPLLEDIRQGPVTPRFQRRQVRNVRGEFCGRVHDQQTVFEKNFNAVTPHGDLGRFLVCLRLTRGRV